MPKLNEFYYFNMLSNVFFNAESDGATGIVIAPILTEADFTAWWSKEGDHFC